MSTLANEIISLYYQAAVIWKKTVDEMFNSVLRSNLLKAEPYTG